MKEIRGKIRKPLQLESGNRVLYVFNPQLAGIHLYKFVDQALILE